MSKSASSPASAVSPLNEPKSGYALVTERDWNIPCADNYPVMSLFSVVSIEVLEVRWSETAEGKPFATQRVRFNQVDGSYFDVTAHREVKAETAVCGKVNSGFACDMPAGSTCPDCGPSCHEVGEGD